MDRNLDAIKKILEEIKHLADGIWNRASIFELRRQFNPHHPPEAVELETKLYLENQQEDFDEMMKLFSENRETFSQLTDLSKNHREMLEALEKVTLDQLEKEFGL